MLGLSDPPQVGSSEAAQLVVPFVARPAPMTASTHIPFTDTNGATRDGLSEYHQPAGSISKRILWLRTGERSGAHLHRGPLHVQRHAVGREHRLMHDLRQSWVREDAVDEVRSRGTKGHGYDESLDQFGNLWPDEMCS